MTVADRPWRPVPFAGRRTDVLLEPDPRRVVARLFLPGQEGTTPGTSRAAGVVHRCLELTEQEASDVLDEIVAAHGDRHRDLSAVLESHYAAVAHRVRSDVPLSARRRRLIGAYFTQEYAVEAAALFNPSLVAHPDQHGPDVAAGGLRFLMSARAVGEGHLSSIVFRTGTVGPGDAGSATVTVDPASRHVVAGAHRSPSVDAVRFRHQARVAGADAESLAFVLSGLPARFTAAEIEPALERLHEQQLTRVHADETIRCIRTVMAGRYDVSFDPAVALSERTLLPAIPVEARGMEDARFVRFVDGDVATYLATYTAFDGNQVSVRRLRTDDFLTFRSSAFTGRAATDKGMALFPRRVGGRYLALSRWDRENTAIASSTDGHHWPDSTVLQTPREPWELIQLGNCGSPIETSEGWLVLTHGVGPMRNYAMGALLLDLDDPTRMIGRLRGPLLGPAPDERDGYVPNVVYSCGGLLHDRTLVLPYGCGDARIRLVLLDLPALLDRLLRPSDRQGRHDGDPRP